MNNKKKSWQQTPISLEQWKENCSNSDHVRPGEKLTFNTNREGKISCGIEGTAVFLGVYFIDGDAQFDILPNTGWNH